MYKQEFLLLCILFLEIYASYKNDVECFVDKDNVLSCKGFDLSFSQRKNVVQSDIPVYKPYVQNAKDAVFYNCTELVCKATKVSSLTQVAFPESKLKYCFIQSPEKYQCEPLEYFYYQNTDKLSFLTNNIPHKQFYLIDCLVYSDGGRVCHKKDDVDSHTKLVDIGNVARPNETNVLSQEEFLCEESPDKRTNCDVDRYVPYSDGLRLKEVPTIDNKILLKTGAYVVTLNYNCINTWCGYSTDAETRRSLRYEPPGGKIYRCYYANKQQICKQIHGAYKNMYNARDWLSS